MAPQACSPSTGGGSEGQKHADSESLLDREYTENDELLVQ